MSILYIERCLAKDSLVFDQIERIDKHVSTWSMAVQVGGYPTFRHPRVTSVRVPFFPKIEPVKGWLFTRAALRAFDRPELPKPFTLLHAHFAYPDGLAALCIHKRFHLPYVITARGDDVLLYPKDNPYLRQTVTAVLQRAAAVIGVSQASCDAAIAFGVPADRCRKIPDGIIPEIFHPRTPPQSSAAVKSAKLVLFAGAFLPVKNVLRMVDAFAQASRQDSYVRFRLAGDGPLLPEMRRRMAHHGIQDKCDFLGQLAAAQLADEMRAAQVLCLPSVSESWGNVIAEAMACGTPVVGSKVGGIPEQITSDDLGFLCDPFSVDDIAAKLLQALARPWNRDLLSQHGNKYTRDATAKAIADVYRELT